MLDKPCKTCGGVNTRKTSSYCRECASKYQKERRYSQMAKQGKQLCPVCKTFQKYDRGHACPTCIEGAKTRLDAARERTQAARDARELKILDQDLDSRVCPKCKERRTYDDFYWSDSNQKLSSYCKECERKRSSKNRIDYDPTIIEPWRLHCYNRNVFICTLTGHTKEYIVKRLERRGNLHCDKDDYRLYIFTPSLHMQTWIQAASPEGLLKIFKRDFIGDQQCTSSSQPTDSSSQAMSQMTTKNAYT